MDNQVGKCMIGMIGVRVCEWECLGHSMGDESLTLTRCYSCRLSQLYEALEGGAFPVDKSVA